MLGQPVGPHGRGPWRRVGHLVETPAAYPELTVGKTWRWRAGCTESRPTRTRPDVPSSGSVSASTQTARRARFRPAICTGWALARALLHEPDLLILDEPANGLDPAGVVEIRELLGELAREQGVTVFMSSHILTEVDRLATRIGIIHQGRLIEELEARQLEALRARRLEVRARDLAGGRAVLVGAGYDVKIVDGHASLLHEARAVDAPDDVATLLVNAGTPPTRLAVEQENLEDYFLRLTGATT